jgi:uncharacterized protein YndB with AHSA1/START domain
VSSDAGEISRAPQEGGAPMKVTISIAISAPIQKVFDLIHDHQKHKLWLDALEETVYEPDYDPAHPLGAKFTQKIREGKAIQLYDGEVTAFKRPHHLAVRLSGTSVTALVDYRLESAKKVTQVEFTSQLTFKNVAVRALAAVSGPILRGILQEQMNKLKAVAEGTLHP